LNKNLQLFYREMTKVNILSVFLVEILQRLAVAGCIPKESQGFNTPTRPACQPTSLPFSGPQGTSKGSHTGIINISQ